MHKPVMKSGILDRVPLSEIVEHGGFNARGMYEYIESLAESIEAHGLKQPLACYRLDVGEDDHDFGVLFLQSGYRRRRALEIVAKKLDDPDMLVDVSIMTYASHDAAMLPALAVDSTGEPLRNYDIAVRVTYLLKKTGCTQIEIARLAGLHPNTVCILVSCMKNLHPRILKVWEKAPSPKAEIPLTHLARWSREPQGDQLALFEAYVNGEVIVDRKGRPKRNRYGVRLDGRKTTIKEMRTVLDRLHVKLEAGGKPTEIARLEGIAKGIRFALGDITKVI